MGLFSKRIFLDYASATPVLLRVQWAMWKYYSRDFYNPNAIYADGERVKKEVEECRTRVARILGVGADTVVFTSGGAETQIFSFHRI